MKTVAWLLLLLYCAKANGAEVNFAHEIVPLLKSRCGGCHSGPERKGSFSINSRESLLAGGESGAAVIPGDSSRGQLYQRIASHDDSLRMPPEGKPLTAAEIALVAKWIAEGAKWEAGFTFGLQRYEPPLKPHRPELPPAVDGRTNPIDRILDAELARHNRQPAPPLDDARFMRRVWLDLIGLLPTPKEQATFLDDPSPDKRNRLARALLDREIDYAEHWLTFWNDLLRNDYTGTGFITGGRKQITRWLYDALVTNKPYDQFARELIAPTAESAGFAEGIRWRGEVSAGQTVEIQFAQSVGQVFLGINLKCASCHDSFIDRWTLEDAYGLAAVYAERPLELHRCDKPTGQTARAAWLFPELGQIEGQTPQKKRLEQLAELMTHRDNGRFTRTIVNRLWHRLMGRGIVHPTDAMQSEPWNADLLDYLAEHLAESGYDLKQTLELIATSQAYQSQAERVTNETDAQGYHYAGPRSKRLTAEQFIDCVWQITGAAPRKFDAPIIRGKVDPVAASQRPASGLWIWNEAVANRIAAGESIAFRKAWHLPSVPTQIAAVVSCDNAYTLYINGKQVHAGDNWQAPDLVALTNIKQGENEILIVASNGGGSPNPAGLFFEARWTDADGRPAALVSDASWQWSRRLPNKNGKYKRPPEDWHRAAAVQQQQIWMKRLEGELSLLLSRSSTPVDNMVRASLLKSDFLMRSLGRPNRDQIVSVRPLELTTLEAIDLANGEALSSTLRQGAAQLQAQSWQSPEALIDWLYRYALCRQPTDEESRVLSAAIGDKLMAEAIEDVLWTVVMLPEFQLVR